jgi:spore germination protein Q
MKKNQSYGAYPNYGGQQGHYSPYGYPSQQGQGQYPTQYPSYPQPDSSLQVPQFPTTQGAPAPQVPGMLPLEQSYIENILRLNKGKIATVYMTFENNKEWNAKVFKGRIEAAGRDHIILSDPQTGMRYLLLMIYLDYVTFDEELEYDYPF